MREAQADANTIPSNGGKNLKQNKANRGRARRGEHGARSVSMGLDTWLARITIL